MYGVQCRSVLTSLIYAGQLHEYIIGRPVLFSALDIAGYAEKINYDYFHAEK